jgi:hypothetical protein
MATEAMSGTIFLATFSATMNSGTQQSNYTLWLAIVIGIGTRRLNIGGQRARLPLLQMINYSWSD